MVGPPMAAFLLLLVFTSLALSPRVQSSPPEAVVKCESGNADCTVTNGYGAYPDRSTCRVAAVVYPTTEEEVVAAVSDAAKKKQHMKVTTTYAHSIPNLSCPGGPDGAGLAISTEKLNKVVSVDRQANRMTFQSGIGLRPLIDAAAKEGLALPYTPYWQGITLGGLLATGSHGSSLFGKGSAVHEYVVGMRLVVPTSTPDAAGRYAKVLGLAEGDADLLAAKVSLGVLGVFSQVTLQLQPMFKRSLTRRVATEEGFESTLETFASTTEFGDISWYVGNRQVVYRDEVRLPITVPDSGNDDVTGFEPLPVAMTAQLRAYEELMEATENAQGKCALAQQRLAALAAPATGSDDNDGSPIEPTNPTIRNNSDLQTSGSCLLGEDDDLLTACAWDRRVGGNFFHQAAFSIPLHKVAAFIADVKKLRDLRPSSLCSLDFYAGILMRFVRASTAHLGKVEDSVDMDLTFYRSRDPMEPRLFEDAIEEVEQMALFKYGALPHWGKNRHVGYLGAMEKLGPTRVEPFIAAMNKYDPEGLFSSDWTDAVLGLRGKSPVVDRKGCALEGLCICTRDVHCAPEKGYACRPGLVYKEARVCRKVDASERSEAAVHSEL